MQIMRRIVGGEARKIRGSPYKGIKKSFLFVTRRITRIIHLLCAHPPQRDIHGMYLKKSGCHEKAFTALFFIPNREDIPCSP